MIVWPYITFNKKKEWLGFKCNVTEFFKPAFLDWMEEILFSIGISQVSASLPVMI